MLKTKEVRDGLNACSKVARKANANFFYASQVLQISRKEFFYATYATMRIIDDLVDENFLKQEAAARQRLSNVEKMEKRFIDFAKKTSQGKSVIARLSLYLDALNAAREQAFFSVSPDQVQSFLSKWDEHDFSEKQSFLNEYVKSIIVKKRSIQIKI